MRIVLLALLLFLGSRPRALDCPAYIINHSGDTIKGVMQINTVYEQLFAKKEVVDFPTVETQIIFAEGTGKKKKLDENTSKALALAITMNGTTLCF